MASPVADSYQSASGAGVYAGRYLRPPWRRAMSAFEWAEIPTSLLSSISPSNDPSINPNYPSRAPWGLTETGNANFNSPDGAMIPWCGGAWNEDERVFWLPLGGGHGDYAGNESYKIVLSEDAPQWVMPRPPSGSLPLIAGGLPAGATPQNNSFLLDDHQETSGVYADGRPRAIHSYRKHVHVPGLGIVMACQGGTFTNVGISSKPTWLMNEYTGEWEWKSTATSSQFANPTDGGACFDAIRGCVYWCGEGLAKIIRLDIETWAWSSFMSNYLNASGNVEPLHVAEYDLILHLSSYWTEKFRIVEPSSGGIIIPTISGAVGSLGACHAWVPGLGLLISDLAGGMTVLAPTGDPRNEPWSWSALPVTGTPPNSSGFYIYSKFGYSKKLGGCYRFLNATTRPWFFATE